MHAQSLSAARPLAARATRASRTRCPPIRAAADGPTDAPPPPDANDDTAAARAAISDLVRLATSSPVEALSFGPRAALGALLSLPELTDRLTTTVERATELLQDPRPPADKAPDAVAALAEDLAGLVRKGAAAEADVVSAIAARLPDDIREALPPDFFRGSAGGGEGTASGGRAAAAAADADAAPPPSPADTAAARSAAEAASLEEAARRVREAATALAQGGGGGGGDALLRLNLQEARAGLHGALGALAPGDASDAPGFGAAVEAARALLADVDGVLSKN